MRIKNDNAVSPVIGVVLMVAITVMLAAVVAAFVFSTAGTLHTNKIVAVTSSQMDDKTISLINMGGQDIGQLTKINVTGDLKILPASLGTTTGSTKSYELSAGVGQKHIIAVGLFKDGTEQVLINTWVTRAAP